VGGRAKRQYCLFAKSQIGDDRQGLEITKGKFAFGQNRGPRQDRPAARYYDQRLRLLPAMCQTPVSLNYEAIGKVLQHRVDG
jgi:hypothetical protein